MSGRWCGKFDEICDKSYNEVMEMLEGVLYIDIQSLPPAGYCEKCGGERYWPSLICGRCGEEAQ
jgi:hypothetical protein